MTDPADRFLEERLHALARGASVPIVPTEDDVRRGRRRLFRMRVAMAGATTAAVAVVLGVTSLTAGDPKATEPPIVDPPSTLPASPSSSPAADSSDDAGSGDQPAGHRWQQPEGRPGRRPQQPAHGRRRGPGQERHQRPGHRGHRHAGRDHPGPDDQPSGTHGSDPTEVPSSTVTPSTTPTGTPTSTPTETPTATPSPTPTVPPTQTPRVRVHRVLRYYNDVLAEHLDPDRLHLQPYNRKLDSKETTTLGGKLFALGSTYRWEDGRSRSGLQIRVASGWDQVDWLCGASYADWDCHLSTTRTRRRPARRPRRSPPTTA